MPKPAPNRSWRLSLTTQFPAGSRAYPPQHKIRTWISAAMQEEMVVTVRLVDEAEARTLNNTYRGKDYATNVLSFDYETTPCSGDLILCRQVIEQECRMQGKALEAHYAHLIVHGTLHLQGFDHEEEHSAQRMEALETKILQELGFPNPYEVPMEIK